MKKQTLMILICSVMLCGGACYGMAMEQIGPVHKEADFGSPSDPAGLAELKVNPSRVYSRWCNGSESVYFNANAVDMNLLIFAFGEMRIRDHEVWLKSGKPEVATFGGDKISYNVECKVIGGFARSVTSLEIAETLGTQDPVLTVYITSDTDLAQVNRFVLPSNIILHNEVEGCTLKSQTTKPDRTVWHAQIQFDDGTPAFDAKSAIFTRITLWEKGIEEGIELGSVDRDGHFYAPFSEDEVADLKTGKLKLTMTVGSSMTKPKRSDPELSPDNLSPLRSCVIPTAVTKPAPSPSATTETCTVSVAND